MKRLRSSQIRIKDTVAVYWELASLFFSFLSIAVVFLLFFEHRESTKRLLLTADLFACLLFALEFVVNLIRSPNKNDFIKKNCPDLVACIPFSQEFRFLRIIRIFRIRKVFHHDYRKRVVQLWRDQAAESVIFFLFTGILPVTFFAIWLILEIEEDVAQANIRTLEDATWWFWVTVTTVGYGDHYPVTMAGRILAGLVMVVGIASFSSLTALIASKLTERWNESHPGNRDREIVALRNQINRLETMITQLAEAESQKRSVHGDGDTVGQPSEGADSADHVGDQDSSPKSS